MATRFSGVSLIKSEGHVTPARYVHPVPQETPGLKHRSGWKFKRRFPALCLFACLNPPIGTSDVFPLPRCHYFSLIWSDLQSVSLRAPQRTCAPPRILRHAVPDGQQLDEVWTRWPGLSGLVSRALGSALHRPAGHRESVSLVKLLKSVLQEQVELRVRRSEIWTWSEEKLIFFFSTEKCNVVFLQKHTHSWFQCVGSLFI